ncbi:MAG: fimbrillin family protein [Parabacteroides sp.]|nr:fimbrillin family protein [Parabacteroides sp.]
MKRIYIVLIFALLAVSCRQEEEIDRAALYPVDFTLPGIEVITRAAGTENLPSDATLTIAAYNATTGELAAQGGYKVSDGSLVPKDNGKPIYLGTGAYDFCAVSPLQTLATDGKSATISKGTDLLGSVTRAEMQPGGTTITLDDLRHLTSQIKFTLRWVYTNTTVKTFKVKTIVISDMVKSGKLLLPENKLDIPGTEVTDRYEPLTIDNTNGTLFDYSATASSGKTGSHYNTQKKPLMVFPRAAEPFTVTVTVDFQDGEVAQSSKTYRATIRNIAFEPGKQYQFMVNYGWDYMNFTVSVSGWDSKDNSQGDTGSGEQEIITSVTVDEWGNPVDLGGNLGGN